MGCPGEKTYQGSMYSSHVSSESADCEKSNIVFTQNMTKNGAKNRGFRTRFIYTCNRKVTNIEALLTMSKQKAVQTGMCALKRMSSDKVQTKKSVPCGSKVNPSGVNHRSYAEVVKEGNNCFNTKFKPRDSTTNVPSCDKKPKMVSITATSANHRVDPADVVPNSLCDAVVKKASNTHKSDKENASNNYDHSQECKIFDINGIDDKYLHSILIASRDKKPWKNSNNESTRASRSQTEFEFSFIPLSQLQEATSGVINQLSNYCPIKAHKIVVQSGKPNFLQARIRVDTQLNLEEWQKQLQGYWDTQLIDLLRFGFPLDFNRLSPLRWEGQNHKSAIDYPNDIETYLAEERSFNAIIGPFKNHPCPNGHISPFMSRDKPQSNNRRVIIDLSWPLGQSVNSGIDKTSYLGTDFTLVLLTVDHITDRLKLLGR